MAGEAARRLGLRGRLLIAGGLAVALMLAGSIVLVTAVDDLRDGARADRRSQQVLGASAELQKLVIDMETGARGFVIAHADRFLAPWRSARGQVGPAAARLAELVHGDPREQATVADIERRIRSYVRDYSEPLVALTRVDPAAARARVARDAGKRRMDAIRARFAALDTVERRTAAVNQQRANSAARRATAVTIAGLAAAVALLLMALAYVTRALVEPLRRLAGAVGRLGEGDLEARVPERSTAEIGDLERGLNAMAASLQASHETLSRQRGELAQALEAVREGKRAAEAQAEENRAVLDSAYDAFVSVQADGTITEWNAQAERLFGWSRAEAVGRNWADLLVPASTRAAYEAVRSRAAAGDEQLDRRTELVGRHRDGRELAIEATFSTAYRHGRPSFNAFVRDIADRRRAERLRDLRLAVSTALAEAGTLQEAAGAVLPAIAVHLGWQVGGCWLRDGDDTLRCAAFWRREGFSAGALEEQTRTLELPVGTGLPGEVCARREPVWLLQEREPSPGYPRAQAGWEAGLRSGVGVPLLSGENAVGALEFFAVEVVHADEATLEELRMVSGLVGQFVERKALEAEAERMKDEFFALVSHELRTPLTSIVGYCEMLLDEEEGGDGLDDDQRHFLTVVDRNAHRLLRLVGDLLFVAQVEAGTVRLELGDVDLAAVAAASIEAARPMAEARNVELALEADALAPLRGDADRLGQALDNLVSNALKFTPAGGRVCVRLAETGEGVAVAVSDSGIGIPADEHERLFDRFFRASSATDRSIPGVGLGLTIVKAIVEGHGGAIGLTSAEGEGTTFHFTLPRPGAGADERSPVRAMSMSGGHR